MNARRNQPVTERAGLRGTGGYSLIEMTIAVVMAAIISMGIYAIFNAQQRSARSQKDFNNLQTSCNFAMDTIKNDLLLAGYNARDTTQPIKAAGANSIQFEFYDQKAGADTSVYDLAYSADTRVTLQLTGTTLEKKIERWRNGCGTADCYTTPKTLTLAKNVQGLDFTYLKGNNEAWSSVDGLGTIREIRIGLRCRAEKANAIFNAPELGTTAPKYQEIALTAEVRPRNVNIARNPDDHTAPEVPASKTGQFIKVWDEGTCGCLKMNWSSNTDSDIAGYMIFYGLAPGSYIGRARVDHVAGSTQTTTLADLPSTGVPYYIALTAFDNSGNQSGLSAEVSGNPTPSIRTLAGTGAGNDTAITPLPPAAPVGLTIGTPADQQITVSWSKTYQDCMTVKTFGYRLYRSTDANFTPSGTSRGYGNCIADETMLGPDTVSYLDRGTDTPAGHLVGCATYYYKLAVVNCDPTQISNYTDPGAGTTTTYTAAQFATISGTPTDGTPTGNPILNSKSGWRRIILSITNPSRDDSASPDFVSTKIYFSKTATPILTSTRDANGFYVVSGGTLLKDRGDPAVDAPGEMSASGGPWAINFDSETAETPSGGIGYPELDTGATYYFLAVAYDRCKNAASGSVSQTAATQCSDGFVGEAWRDAPPPPLNVRFTKGCDGRPLKIEWDYPTGYYLNNPDIQGFRVVRCTGVGCVPTKDPDGGTGTVIGSTTYLTPDLFVQDDTVDNGLIYNYRVFAGDCYYQRWLENLPLDPDNPPQNNASYVNLSNVSLGYFGRAQVTGDAKTMLTAALLPSTTTIDVVSTTGFTRNTFQIGGEVVECAGATTTSFTDCTRGAQATIATTHFLGDIVTNYPPAPPRAAVTGDLNLNPVTFLHNVVKVAAENTSAGTLLLRKLEPISWQNIAAWLKKIVYFGTTTETMYDGATLPSGSNVTLNPTTVDAKILNVPVSFTFLRQDGSLDGLVNMRNDLLYLKWLYRNDSTLQECQREWVQPYEIEVAVPEGPSVYGVSQSAPNAGTLAWPVPGNTNNPTNAVIVPAGSRTRVSAYIQNNAAFGTSIASARLYYYVGAPTDTAAPAVTSAYPACTPYAMEEMTNITGTTLWYADIPSSTSSPVALNNKSVWYFIVGVDSEGNFGRAPEVRAGAFEYFQRPPDPCTDIPLAPVLAATGYSSSVVLDWSGSWTVTPPATTATYKNRDGSDITDLAGFEIYRQIGTGTESLLVTTPNPLPATQKTYTDTFTTASSNLITCSSGCNGISATATSGSVVINMNSTAGFIIPGKLQIDAEVFSCPANASNDAWHLYSCTRAINGTVAAAHPAGALVTQNLRALENINYTVKAFDGCTSSGGTPTPNYSYASNKVTAFPAGGCSPVCDMTVSPTTIKPGDSFDITVTACAKAANATVDTIYLQGCSECDDDAIELRETGPSTGVFQPYDSTTGTFTRIATSIVSSTACTGGGGNWTLTVKGDVNSTIRIGGWSDTASPWGGGTCQSGPFSCGSEQIVYVIPTPPDPCAVTIAPPATPTISSVATTVCSNTQYTASMTVNYTGDAQGTDLFYRVYRCDANQNSTCTPAMIYPASLTTFPATATPDPYVDTDPLALVKSNKDVFYQVEAVRRPAGCTDTTKWKTTKSAAVKDNCN